MRNIFLLIALVFTSLSMAQIESALVDEKPLGEENAEKSVSSIFGPITMRNGSQIRFALTGHFHKGSIVGVHDYSKGRWGGGGGFFAQYPFKPGDVDYSENYYLMWQFEYNTEGEFAKPNEGTQDIFTQYVSTQVYMKYFYTRGNIKRTLFFFGGPRISYLLSHKRQGPPIYAMYYNQDINMNKWSLAATIGAGFKINTDLEIFMRYDRGFSKVYPDYNHRHTYNRFLALGLNFFLN